MEFKYRDTKQRQGLGSPAEVPCEPSTPGTAQESANPQENDGQGLLVHHGIHEGTYRVAGLSVAQARRLFSRPMNIPSDAVAVIAGEIIENEDERVLQDTDNMLSFVQRSSVKGAAEFFVCGP